MILLISSIIPMVHERAKKEHWEGALNAAMQQNVTNHDL